jgi:hypothetical protein
MLKQSCPVKVSVFFTQNEPNFRAKFEDENEDENEDEDEEALKGNSQARCLCHYGNCNTQAGCLRHYISGATRLRKRFSVGASVRMGRDKTVGPRASEH